MVGNKPREGDGAGDDDDEGDGAGGAGVDDEAEGGIPRRALTTARTKGVDVP